ncbi:rRNA processing protein [Orbilia blumenaviensis]|uniref:Pre-rRNA-processing protein n=1 Tax=Orbilia blumenaviensis TaxID=1796055 RepID=A0AAV9VC43_9PEZI
MGSSSKKKKEKQKDFVKPKLKVGKTKPKADNHTSTSFKAKAIVVGHQSLNTAAPTIQSQLKHNLTLLNHHAYTTRRDSLAHIASVLSSSSVSTPPISYSILLPALAPLIVDLTGPVRAQLLTLLNNHTKSRDPRQDAIIPVDAIRMHTPRFLLYIHSAMTHISAEIRADSTNFLSWLLDVVGEEAVRGAKGWGKTLKCWIVLLGWESAKSGRTARGSTIEFSDPGKNKKATLQHLGVLKQFLYTGMVEEEAQISDFEMRDRDLLLPHQYSDVYMMPKTSNVYGYLNIFGIPAENTSEEDAEGSSEDCDSRRRVVKNVFEGSIRTGLQARLQEGGEVGRAAGAVLKILDKGLRTDSDTTT